MRKPSFQYLLTPTLFALAAAGAHAAAPMGSAAAGSAAASPAPVATAPAAGAAPSGSMASFSNSASTSTSTSAATSTSGASSSSASPSGTTSTPGVAIPNETLRNQSTSQTNQATIGPTTDAASFGPDSPFVNNTNPQVGLSPGQTSTGIAGGNEPSGLENSTTTGTFTQNGTGTLTGIATPVAAGTVLPAGVVGGGGYAGGGGTAVGGTAVAISPGLAGSAGSATPLLDQATRNAARREEQRRATGNPPRIIGIAPRTNVDRTDEMPDDPIIRY
jgi:hypothetical protein